MENITTSFSVLLFIIAIHFLLQGINYRKVISLYEQKENFVHKKECVPIKTNVISKCIPSKVVGSNTFVNNENDSNFQSNVLDKTTFYKKNKPEDTNTQQQQQQQNTHIPESSNQWNYKNEFVMNGGELMNGVTGINNDLNSFYNLNNNETNFNNCFPFTKNSILDDDMRK